MSRLAVLLVFYFVVSSATLAHTTMTTEAIQRVLSAAVAKANELKVPMGIAVVDSNGALVGFMKMPGTFVHTQDSAYAKAYTAVSLRRPTHALDIPAQVLAELASVTQGKITPLPGGLPLLAEEGLVGGIGVGGGNAEQDRLVAQAGAAAMARQP
jgi:cob(I)alamin adenosyltransferase